LTWLRASVKRQTDRFALGWQEPNDRPILAPTIGLNGMDWRLILEFLVLIGVLAMGARMGGVGLGLWGAVGLLVL
jgi:hypothetical protein